MLIHWAKVGGGVPSLSLVCTGWRGMAGVLGRSQEPSDEEGKGQIDEGVMNQLNGLPGGNS